MTTQDIEALNQAPTSPEGSSTEGAGQPDQGQQDANSAAPSSSDGAEPEDAKGGDDPKAKLFDIVRDAVKGGTDTAKGEPKDASSAAEDGSQGTEGDADGKSGDAKADGLTDEDKDADGKPLPFHKHPRWQEMKAERDELKQEVERFKPNAEQFQVIQDFMSERNLSADEVGQGFEVMSLIKNDPEAALQYLEGAVSILRQGLGKELPDDLREAVEYGEISEAKARELSETRAKARMSQEQFHAARNAQAAQAQQADAARHAQAIQGAVMAWESNVAKRDLDYPKKAEMVLHYAKAIRADLAMKGKTTLTPEEAVQVTQQAYEQVNAQMKTFSPRKATDPNPSSSVSSKSASPSEPKSLLDAARRGAQMSVTSGH